MRAAVLTGSRKFEIREVPSPKVGPGQVRFRVQGCGVCGSNPATWIGMPWTQYPTEPGALGHEAWGVIDETGPDVSPDLRGQRITALSYHAFAEYDVANTSAVIRIPDELANAPIPGEAIGCAMNVFRRSEIGPGDTVAIIGVGFMGALLTKLANQAGARVLAISRRPFSLSIARLFGADETIPMDDHHRIIERVKELTDGKLCDRVIEAVGKQWPLDLAAELTRERGRLMIAGYHQDGPRQVNMWLWNWRGLDVINAHERSPAAYVEGIRLGVEAIASGKLNPFPLLTHTYPLEKLGEALDATLERPEGFLKALVKP